MYKIFAQNLNNYFFLNENGDTGKEFRLKIAQALRGMADKELYGQWAVENEGLYAEVNNLVYEIQHNTDRFRTFRTFSWELWGYDYKAEKSDKFSKEIVEEQLKLINLLLGTQYWIDISHVN